MKRIISRLFFILAGISAAMLLVSCDVQQGAREITYDEVKAIVYDDAALKEVYLLDVRKLDAYDNGYIQNARNIDLEDLVDSFGDIIDNGAALTGVVEDTGAKIIAYCDGYGRSSGEL